MLANQLTQSLSKKWLISLLIVTIGADLALYASRQSYFMEMIYTNILLFSILVAVKLAPRLKDEAEEALSKRKLFSVFVKSFLILYLVGTINDFYSSQTFTEFSEDRSLIAEEFSSRVESFEEDNVTADAGYTFSDRVYEWLDTIGYDFYDYFLAGLEEVWRLSYMVLILLALKKIMPRVWGKRSKDLFLLVALILSSLLFGLGHSLSAEQEVNVLIGTVVSYTNMGLVLGYLLLRTRNLWLLVVVHGLYNVLTSLSWTYFTYMTEVFIALILLVNGVLWLASKMKRSKVQPQNIEL